jgi:hypothetical protein
MWSVTWETEMMKLERLAVAVRAEVASVRAEQAQRRHARLKERAAPVYRAMGALRRRYGDGHNVAEHIDEFRALVSQYGSVGDLLELVRLLAGMSGAVAAHDAEAAAAWDALVEAMDPRLTVLEWVGCSDEEYERAVLAALDV